MEGIREPVVKRSDLLLEEIDKWFRLTKPFNLSSVPKWAMIYRSVNREFLESTLHVAVDIDGNSATVHCSLEELPFLAYSVITP